MRNESFALVTLAVCALLPFAARSPAADPATSNAADKDIVKWNLEPHGYACLDLTRTESGYFVVRAVIDGKPLSLIVDTGAPCAHLDLARLRAREIPWPTGVGRTKKEVGNLPAFFETVRIGPVLIGRMLALPDDLSDMNERLAADGEPPADGLLGGDVLTTHAAVIDLARSRLFLRRHPIESAVPIERSLHDTFGEMLLAGDYRCVDLELNAGIYPAVESEIDGRILRLLVDTGAPAVFLDRRRTEALRLPWRERLYRLTPQGPLRRRAWSPVASLQIQTVALGPLTVWSTDALAKVNESTAGLGGKPFDGLLGTDVMIARAAVIDCPTIRLYLRRTAEP
jgi:predicted aspartyl protease